MTAHLPADPHPIEDGSRMSRSTRRTHCSPSQRRHEAAAPSNVSDSSSSSSEDSTGSYSEHFSTGCPLSSHDLSVKVKRCPMANIDLSDQDASFAMDESRPEQKPKHQPMPRRKSANSLNNLFEESECRLPPAIKSSATTSSTASISDSISCSTDAAGNVGLNANVVKSLHPYHIIVDQHFSVVQVGNSLPTVLGVTEETDLCHQHIEDVMEIVKPMGMVWNWKWLQLMEDQHFDIEPINEEAHEGLKFTATVVHISHAPAMAMLILVPAANNLNELRDMNLTLSDLPVHGAHRDAIFLREHLSTQMNNALKMEKLSRSLEQEKNLLHSLLPTHAAEGLRTGKTVEPMLHNNVTFFFSDVVGFTKICDQIYPWDVISMLNKLYMVMDYLAKKFNLYKVETIGDGKCSYNYRHTCCGYY
jgi:Adenylate and Guanylate cyclase catalytic domain/Heme NO binding associated